MNQVWGYVPRSLGDGRPCLEADHPPFISLLIPQVLLTVPGERVSRPHRPLTSTLTG